MLKAFQRFISTHKLVLLDERVLLAISGGVDSVVMADLFHQTGISFAIAHCNFDLRGKESDADEEFVMQLAEQYRVSCYVKKFNTKKEAQLHGLSIQMAARELRYKWFRELSVQENYNKFATAHHRTDLLETQLINFTRGTGITGMKGFLPILNDVIRPLLYVTHNDIVEYAINKGLEYREDSSNASDKYARNKIRHHVLPILKEINPSVENTAWENAIRFSQAEMLNKWAIDQFKMQSVSVAGEEIIISLKEISNKDFARIILYEILSEYGFNEEQVNEILTNAHSGRKFDSYTHTLYTGRKELHIVPIRIDNEQIVFSVDLNSAKNEFPGFVLKINKQNYETDFAIPRSNNIVCIDAGKLQAPIELRKWRKGDFFFPLGMNNRKLLSDFFIDNKLSIAEKENTWLLTSRKNIVWIVGQRIDERYKVTADTKELLVFEIEK